MRRGAGGNRRASPAGGRDADHPAPSLIELNTCAPPRGRGGQPEPEALQEYKSRRSLTYPRRRGGGENTNCDNSLMDGRIPKRPMGVSKCCNR
jgi:hypothetical protein